MLIVCKDTCTKYRSCSIVGAGLIGLEMADAFKKKGRLTERAVGSGRENGARTGSSRDSMDVMLVEMADHILAACHCDDFYLLT